MNNAPFKVGDRIMNTDTGKLGGRTGVVTEICNDPDNAWTGWRWILRWDDTGIVQDGWMNPARWKLVGAASPAVKPNTGGTDMAQAVSKLPRVEQVITWRDFRDVLRRPGECPCGGSYGHCKYHPQPV